MKRTVSIVALLLSTLMLASCSGGRANKITAPADLEGEVVAALSTPLDPALYQAKAEEAAGVKFEEMLFFETTSAAVAALKSGQADAAFTADICMDFYTSMDESLASFPVALPGVGASTSHMALRAEDAELLSAINAAIVEMREDGTLARLAQEYVTDFTMTYEGRDMPRFEGARTLMVGIGGDVPPLDYVAADGKPGGYNVELLALLGEKLEMNIEISVAPMASKFPALAARRIDMYFFHAQNKGVDIMTSTMAQNPGIALTEPYFEIAEFGFLVMKEEDAQQGAPVMKMEDAMMLRSSKNVMQLKRHFIILSGLG